MLLSELLVELKEQSDMTKPDMPLVVIRDGNSSQIIFGYITVGNMYLHQTYGTTYINLVRDIMEDVTMGKYSWQDSVEINDSKLVIVHNKRVVREWEVMMLRKSLYYCDDEEAEETKDNMSILQSILAAIG